MWSKLRRQKPGHNLLPALRSRRSCLAPEVGPFCAIRSNSIPASISLRRRCTECAPVCRMAGPVAGYRSNIAPVRFRARCSSQPLIPFAREILPQTRRTKIWNPSHKGGEWYPWLRSQCCVLGCGLVVRGGTRRRRNRSRSPRGVAERSCPGKSESIRSTRRRSCSA